MELKVTVDNELFKRFEISLQLSEKSTEEVIDSLLRSYVSQVFSQEAAAYNTSSSPVVQITDKNYGKANHRIPQWAKKTSLISHKIIRAFFRLAENGTVTYDMLFAYCSAPVEHPDVYVPTFSSNFSQMKLDSDKSLGKVFEVSEDGVVTVWNYVEKRLNEYKMSFLVHSTDVGYINVNGQRNIGKTMLKGNDHMQYLYKMHCDKCGYEYHANGTDIFQKKCPHCQDGTETGAEKDA